jgi:hypothetical protein
MNYGIRLLALVATFFSLASLATAATVGGPATGLWYNPTESGRGYNIDLQGDTMIVTTYIYEASGDPIWYLSSGTYNHDTGVFTSSYDSYSNGQCFGCPYVAPVLQSGAAGPITITFATNQVATLTYANGTGSTQIVKYNYGFPTKTDSLYGEWAFTYESGGVVSGDWIVFDTPYTDANGIKYASGRAAGAPTTTAVGTYNPQTFEVAVTVTQGTTQRLYRFGIFDDHRAIGLAIVYLPGVPPSASMTATGARLLYKSELAGGIIGSTGDAQGASAMVQSDAQSLAAGTEDDAALLARMQGVLAEIQATQK